MTTHLSVAHVQQVRVGVGLETLVVEQFAVVEVARLRHARRHRRAARVVDEVRMIDAVDEDLSQLHDALPHCRQLQSYYMTSHTSTFSYTCTNISGSCEVRIYMTLYNHVLAHAIEQMEH